MAATDARSAAHEIGLDRLVFEAPLHHQQTWLINRFGPEINLGNIPPNAVVSLESLRLGLRSETVARLPRRLMAGSRPPSC